METKPKYFVVMTDNTNPLQKIFKKWLNETYNAYWHIDDSPYNYYGYDGLDRNETKNGSNGYDSLDSFGNNPTVLTLQQWYEIFITNKDNKMENNKTQTVSLGQLKELYRFDDCSEWKNHIKEEYLVPNVAEKDSSLIRIKQDSIDLLIKKGTEVQIEKVKEIGILIIKNLPKSWKELDGSLCGYLIEGDDSTIQITTPNLPTTNKNQNIIPTKELAEEILEFIQLSQCYYQYVGDWKPDFNDRKAKFGFNFFNNKLQKQEVRWSHTFFVFPTPEMRDEFMKNFEKELHKCKSLV